MEAGNGEGGEGVFIEFGTGFRGWKAVEGGLGEVVFEIVERWARKGRRNVGGRMNDCDEDEDWMIARRRGEANILIMSLVVRLLRSPSFEQTLN